MSADKDKLKEAIDVLTLSVHKHKDGEDCIDMLDKAMSVVDTIMNLQDKFQENKAKSLVTKDMFAKN